MLFIIFSLEILENELLFTLNYLQWFYDYKCCCNLCCIWYDTSMQIIHCRETIVIIIIIIIIIIILIIIIITITVIIIIIITLSSQHNYYDDYQLWDVCLLLMRITGTRTDTPLLGVQLLRSILYRWNTQSYTNLLLLRFKYVCEFTLVVNMYDRCVMNFSVRIWSLNKIIFHLLKCALQNVFNCGEHASSISSWSLTHSLTHSLSHIHTASPLIHASNSFSPTLSFSYFYCHRICFCVHICVCVCFAGSYLIDQTPWKEKLSSLPRE